MDVNVSICFFDTNKWKIELCLLKSQNIVDLYWRRGNNWIFLLWGVQRVLGRYCVLSSVSHKELVVIGLLNNETSVIEFINSRRFMSNEQWVAPDSVRANDNPDMSLDNLLKLWLRIPGTMRLKKRSNIYATTLGNDIKILKTICIWFFSSPLWNTMLCSELH